jgi:phosphoglycolate phosphatase-like HAD superfamily hydrolase
VSIPAFQLYLFDIDGTLLDSAADICGAARETLEAAGATGLSDTQLRSYIGYHLKELFADVFPGISEERSEELFWSIISTMCRAPTDSHVSLSRMCCCARSRSSASLRKIACSLAMPRPTWRPDAVRA